MDHTLGLQNEILFGLIAVFGRGISNAICDLVLYLLKEGVNISSTWIIVSWFQNLKTVVAVQSSTLYSTGSQFTLIKCKAEMWVCAERSQQYRIHFLWAIWNLFLNALLSNGYHDVQHLSKCDGIRALQSRLLYAGFKNMACLYKNLSFPFIFLRT